MDIPDYMASTGDATFSPDGLRHAIVGGDGLQIWDIEHKQKVLDLAIHSS